MTVSELIDVLSKSNLDAKVIISKDEEGNNYSPLCDVYDGLKYLPYNGWCGEVSAAGEEDCVVLFPVN